MLLTDVLVLMFVHSEIIYMLSVHESENIWGENGVAHVYIYREYKDACVWLKAIIFSLWWKKNPCFSTSVTATFFFCHVSVLFLEILCRTFFLYLARIQSWWCNLSWQKWPVGKSNHCNVCTIVTSTCMWPTAGQHSAQQVCFEFSGLPFLFTILGLSCIGS